MKLFNLKKHGFMLRVSKSEAISLIISLARQIEDDNPNRNRGEYAPIGTTYFSISVNEETKNG